MIAVKLENYILRLPVVFLSYVSMFWLQGRERRWRRRVRVGAWCPGTQLYPAALDARRRGTAPASPGAHTPSQTQTAGPAPEHVS